jgi:hypothetical protein
MSYGDEELKEPSEDEMRVEIENEWRDLAKRTGLSFPSRCELRQRETTIRGWNRAGSTKT